MTSITRPETKQTREIYLKIPFIPHLIHSLPLMDRWTSCCLLGEHSPPGLLQLPNPQPSASSAKQQVRRVCGRTWPSESARTSRDLSLRDIRTDKDKLQESVPVGAVLEFLVQSRWRPPRAAVSTGVSRSSPDQPSQSWRAQITGNPPHRCCLRKDSLLRMSRRRQF